MLESIPDIAAQTKKTFEQLSQFFSEEGGYRNMLRDQMESVIRRVAEQMGEYARAISPGMWVIVPREVISPHIRRWDAAFPPDHERRVDGPFTVSDGDTGRVMWFRNIKACLTFYQREWSKFEHYADPNDAEMQEVLRWYRRHQFGPGFP